MDSITGYVYLNHFAQPICPTRTTQHYIGWGEDLATRIQTQQTGGPHAARLHQVAKERNITFTVARAWRGGRALERKLKNRKKAWRLCTICNPANQQSFDNDLTSGQIADALIPF